MSKRAPKFQDSLEQKAGPGPKKKKKRDPDYFKIKYEILYKTIKVYLFIDIFVWLTVKKNIRRYRKPLNLLIEEEQLANPDGPNYATAAAPPSKFPPRCFCSVCGFQAPYSCIQCGSKFCATKCLTTHQETRCLKWTA